MSYFEEHKVVSTVISITIALAAVSLLFYLSSTANDTVPPAPGDQYTDTGRSGDGAGDGNGAADGGNGTDTDDATVAVQVTEPGDIQQVDFSQMLAPQIGEGQEIEGILLLDVDGNGTQEALLLVRGAGERRPLDWYLYGLDGGTALELYSRTGVPQGEVRLDGPRIAEQAAAYQPGDADCCPSQVATTFYVWKDGGLQVSKTEVSPAGAGS